jgi:hypothetical protein
MADEVTDMGDLDRLLDQIDAKAKNRYADDPFIELRALVSELVRQNKALSEEREQWHRQRNAERAVADIQWRNETTEAATRRFGFEAGMLQSFWRSPECLTRTTYDAAEIEQAMCDAMVFCGGGYVWPGDGASCMEQIVRLQWDARREAEAKVVALTEERDEARGCAESYRNAVHATTGGENNPASLALPWESVVGDTGEGK